MRLSLPTPDEILEELADKVALQIDRQAPVAFDAALKEMTRYHRFLLSLNATRTIEGEAFSYAAVQAESWIAPHDEWITQYRRLFERAANRIADDSDYFAKLAHAPLALLPRGDDPALADNVIQSILDLGSMMAHRLEAWVTKRSVVENAPGAAAIPRVGLSGSDSRAYANLMRHVVSAWESSLLNVPSLFHWKDEDKGDSAKRWDTLRTSWPFVWKHLQTTANILAAAVWNEDDAGSQLYRDALVRWPETLQHQLGDRAEFIERRLLFPDILKVGWDGAAVRAKLLLPAYIGPAADELYSAAVHGAHDDVLLLTAALFLHWSVEKKQVSDIAANRAAELLRREYSDREDWRGPKSQQRSFSSLMMDVVRLDAAGQRFDKATYGSDLDRFVERLDNMTERRVVPGRIFTPSTLRGRDELQVSILAILLVHVPIDGDGGIAQRIRDYARNEAALPEGDRTLRNLLSTLSRFSKALKEPPPSLQNAVAILKPDVDVGATSQSLLAVLAAMSDAIVHERMERLRARTVHPPVLEQLRVAAEKGLQDVLVRGPFFRGFTIEKVPDLPNVESFTVRLDGVSKAQLVDPPMESQDLNLEEVYARGMAENAAGRIWGFFNRQPRVNVAIQARIEDAQFWSEVKKLALDVGAEPRLLVSREAEARALRKLIYKPAGQTGGLTIEKKNRDEGEGNSYIATIEGVDVYSSGLPAGTAWLFSSHILQKVRYKTDAAGRIVTLEFVLGEDFKGSIVSKFVQDTVWADWTVYDIDCHDPAGGTSD